MPPGAWILTSALRTGLARYVGQAVRDHSLASTSTKARVVAIGIASLGRVLHRQLLDDAQVSVRLRALWPWGHSPQVSPPQGGREATVQPPAPSRRLTTPRHPLTIHHWANSSRIPLRAKPAMGKPHSALEAHGLETGRQMVRRIETVRGRGQ